MNKQKFNDLKQKAKEYTPEIIVGVTILISIAYGFRAKRSWPHPFTEKELEQARRVLEDVTQTFGDLNKGPSVNLSSSDRERLKKGAAIVFEYGKDCFCLMHCTDDHS